MQPLLMRLSKSVNEYAYSPSKRNWPFCHLVSSEPSRLLAGSGETPTSAGRRVLTMSSLEEKFIPRKPSLLKAYSRRAPDTSAVYGRPHCGSVKVTKEPVYPGGG